MAGLAGPDADRRHRHMAPAAKLAGIQRATVVFDDQTSHEILVRGAGIACAAPAIDTGRWRSHTTRISRRDRPIRSGDRWAAQKEGARLSLSSRTSSQTRTSGRKPVRVPGGLAEL
jgi:hypothetical protein